MVASASSSATFWCASRSSAASRSRRSVRWSSTRARARKEASRAAPASARRGPSRFPVPSSPGPDGREARAPPQRRPRRARRSRPRSAPPAPPSPGRRPSSSSSSAAAAEERPARVRGTERPPARRLFLFFSWSARKSRVASSFAFASFALAAGRRAGASSASPPAFATGSVGEGGGRFEPIGRGRGTGDSGVGTFDAFLALFFATSASDALGSLGLGRSGFFEGAAPGSGFFGDRNTVMPPLGTPRRSFPPVGPPDMARPDDWFETSENSCARGFRQNRVARVTRHNFAFGTRHARVTSAGAARIAAATRSAARWPEASPLGW